MALTSKHPMFLVSSFNQIIRSIFTQFCLENPHSHILLLSKPKLELVPSQSCKVAIARVIGIWKCLLECQDWSPTMFLNTNCNHHSLLHANLKKAFIMKGGNFAEHVFVKCCQNKNKNKTWQPTWHLIGVEDFNIKHCFGCLSHPPWRGGPNYGWPATDWLAGPQCDRHTIRHQCLVQHLSSFGVYFCRKKKMNISSMCMHVTFCLSCCEMPPPRATRAPTIIILSTLQTLYSPTSLIRHSIIRQPRYYDTNFVNQTS